MSQLSLHEIVFEHRNKEYGAYVLRRDYAKNASIGFIISIVIVLGFCLYFVFDTFIIPDSYNFSPEVMKFAEYNIDEELLKATKLEPLEDKTEKTEPIKHKNIEEKSTPAEDLKVATGMNFVDSVRYKDSVELVEQTKKREEEENNNKIDSLPLFKGSTDAFRNYLVSSIPYPDTSYVRIMKGKLMISFIITETGEPDFIQLDNFAETRWGRSIMFAIKHAPKWQPAYRKGKPVKMHYSIPVYFAQQ